jgi:hypothetical protein
MTTRQPFKISTSTAATSSPSFFCISRSTVARRLRPSPFTHTLLDTEAVEEAEAEEVVAGEEEAEARSPVLNVTLTAAQPGVPPTKTLTSCPKTKMATLWLAKLRKLPDSAKKRFVLRSFRKESVTTLNANTVTSSMWQPQLLRTLTLVLLWCCLSLILPTRPRRSLSSHHNNHQCPQRPHHLHLVAQQVKKMLPTPSQQSPPMMGILAILAQSIYPADMLPFLIQIQPRQRRSRWTQQQQHKNKQTVAATSKQTAAQKNMQTVAKILVSRDQSNLVVDKSKQTAATKSKQTAALTSKQTAALKSKQTAALTSKQTAALKSKQTAASKSKQTAAQKSKRTAAQSSSKR